MGDAGMAPGVGFEPTIAFAAPLTAAWLTTHPSWNSCGRRQPPASSPRRDRHALARAVTFVFRQLSESRRERAAWIRELGTIQHCAVQSGVSYRLDDLGTVVGLDGIEPSPHGVRIRHAASKHLKPSCGAGEIRTLAAQGKNLARFRYATTPHHARDVRFDSRSVLS